MVVMMVVVMVIILRELQTRGLLRARGVVDDKHRCGIGNRLEEFAIRLSSDNRR